MSGTGPKPRGLWVTGYLLGQMSPIFASMCGLKSPPMACPRVGQGGVARTKVRQAYLPVTMPTAMRAQGINTKIVLRIRFRI